ncbi:MAG: AAA family ATPase [Myxococcota bacterium]
MSNESPAAIRLPAEQRWRAELDALRATDDRPRPDGWALSPKAVWRFVVGDPEPLVWTDDDGVEHTVILERKVVGHDVLVERAITTLASDRALLLIGEPGTAKSWLSEHLAAAISGTSRYTIQGTAGLTEDQIKYAWNYALLLAEGPSRRALVPAPLHDGMSRGAMVRFEEITRAPHEVQDTLLQALSEKLLFVPELEGEDGMVLASPGFNVIATANTRDRGVHEMSAALKRRFHFETVPPIADLQQEMAVVRSQVEQRTAHTPAAEVTLDEGVLELLVTTFHELRDGRTTDGTQLSRPATAMSTAEAVAVGQNAVLQAAFFGDHVVEPGHVVMQLAGTVAKEDDAEAKVLRDYFEVAVKPRAARDVGLWKAYYAARDRI